MQSVSQDTYEADVVAASHERPVVVDFWGPRCGPCLKMMPWVEGLAERAADSLKIVKVNSAENRHLCIGLRVMSLPTFILYRDGVELKRLSGNGCNPSTITAAIREVAPAVDLATDGAPVEA